jgi:hypothetical protein
MKRRHSASKIWSGKLCCCLLLAVALAGCGNNENASRTDNRSRSSDSSSSQDNSASTSQETSDDGSAPSTQTSAGPNDEVCRKYDSCGCQKYDQCMAELENSTAINEPGNRECLLKSSCQSLCAGSADGCRGPSTGAGNPGGAPPRTNCAAIHCGSNSDCPTECYGRCGDFRVCLSF